MDSSFKLTKKNNAPPVGKDDLPQESLSEYYEERKKILFKKMNINKCEDNPIVKFCSCNYIHFNCLKDKISKSTYTKENEKVKNYYINHLKCGTCDYIFPIHFKLGEKQYDLIKIEKPSTDSQIDYIILESIEKKIFYGNMKLIHVIQFKNDEPIKIGRRNDDNDVIICDPSVSKEHAYFKYDKNKKSILRFKHNSTCLYLDFLILFNKIFPIFNKN